MLDQAAEMLKGDGPWEAEKFVEELVRFAA
jgi:hypothetical protein